MRLAPPPPPFCQVDTVDAVDLSWSPCGTHIAVVDSCLNYK